MVAIALSRSVELVAVLPGSDAAVAFDDVAVTEGTGKAVEIDLAEASQKALGTASALAVRSADLENPATLLAVLPGDVPPALAALHAAGLGALSDIGASLTAVAKDAGLRSAVQSATWPDGRPVYNVPVALSIMVFFALCAQCASTLLVIHRETNSWLWPVFTFVYMTTLAYCGAFAAYRLGMMFT